VFLIEHVERWHIVINSMWKRNPINNFNAKLSVILFSPNDCQQQVTISGISSLKN
jgi:hypothetical protein